MWILTKGWNQWRILIIKWIGWPIPGTPVSLFFQSPLSLPHGLRNKMAAEMEVIRGLSNMTSTSQTNPGRGQCRMPGLQAVETNTELLMWHHSQSWSTSYQVTSWLHWTAFIMEGTAFCSYSGYGVAFLHAILLPKLQFVDFLNAVHDIMVFYIELFLIKEVTSQ